MSFKQVYSNNTPVQDNVMKKTIIKVNRSAKIKYGCHDHQLLHPELEKVGPAEYDLIRIRHWTDKSQCDKSQWTFWDHPTYGLIYRHLNENGLLVNCLGLHDLLALKRRSNSFLYEHFSGNSIIGWKSAVRDGNQTKWFPLLVPGMVKIWWTRYDEPADHHVVVCFLK